MRLMKTLCATIFIVGGVVVSFSTWAALPIKSGLWEIQPNMQLQSPNGNLQMPDMSQIMQKMSPEMRSQMGAMMQKQGMSMGDNGRIQICLTQDMIERNQLPQKNGCASTVTRQSGNKYLFHFSCGNPPTIGDGEVLFQNAESYTSHVKVTRQGQAKEQSMNMESSAKWLKSDCGSLKPIGN